jgi:outer membrane lipoprotein SlyB
MKYRQMLALLTASLVGCATARPIVYNNQKYQQAGKAAADRDIAECRALADDAGATPGQSKAGEIGKTAGLGAVTGAAAGAVGGAIGGAPAASARRPARRAASCGACSGGCSAGWDRKHRARCM